MDRTSKLVRVGSWSAAAVLGAGLVSGVTWAVADSGSGAGSSGSSAVVTARHMMPGMAGRRGLLRHLEHGQLTLWTRAGQRVVDVQKGTVDTVDAGSISVTSRGGFQATYTVTSVTKVRAHGGASDISAVKPGDRVLVIGSDGTARRIFDPGHPTTTG